MMDKVDIVNKGIITSDSFAFKEAEIEYDSNCSTGDNDYLLLKLMTSLKRARTIDIIVGFFNGIGGEIAY